MAIPSSFHDAFARAASEHPEARFVVHSDVRPETTTLAEVFRRGEAVGARFREMGIGKGDVVAVMLPAWSEWLTALVGAAYAGAVFLPIVTIYKAKELAFVLRQSRAKAIITPQDFRGMDFAALLAECGDLPDMKHHLTVGDSYSALEQGPVGTEPVRVAPEAFAFLVYTSGTTADPKGVMHSGATLLAELDAQAEARGPVEGETYLSPWPPGHVAGALQLLRFIANGIPVVAMDQWNAHEAARLVDTYRITASSGTPFHMSGLLDAAAEDWCSAASISEPVSCMRMARANTRR